MAILGKVFLETLDFMALKGIDRTEHPEEEASRRMQICSTCPMMKKAKGHPVCTVCFCDLEVKTKLVYDPLKSWKSGINVKCECPQGKWLNP